MISVFRIIKHIFGVVCCLKFIQIDEVVFEKIKSKCFQFCRFVLFSIGVYIILCTRHHINARTDSIFIFRKKKTTILRKAIVNFFIMNEILFVRTKFKILVASDRVTTVSGYLGPPITCYINIRIVPRRFNDYNLSEVIFKVLISKRLYFYIFYIVIFM